jgi:hypothetical protein
MNYPVHPGVAGETADAILMDVAGRIQLSPTKHAEATRNYLALCQHVDRAGSPLEGLVIECYPSGSFAIGAAIASNVASAQHDIDAVMELDVDCNASPSWLLGLLYEAINGEPGSRYYGHVRRNSRCVTVTYENGVTVDLMPVARFQEGPPRAGHLFHFKDSSASYHKEVNPWAFKECFNDTVKVDEAFAKALSERRLLVEKAATQPMPDHVPLEEKSTRVAALQLIKRNRDINYRKSTHAGRRPPPSIIHAALVLEMEPPSASLLDEVIAVAAYIRSRITAADRSGNLVTVCNPAHTKDIFTDRWPADRSDQQIHAADLQVLIDTLDQWRGRAFGPEEIAAAVKPLFGESVATRLVEDYLQKRAREADSGELRFSPGGRVASALSTTAFAPRPSTHFGGDLEW